MTVEERALKLARELRADCLNNRAPYEDYLHGKIIQILRDQIEDCAKVADFIANFLKDNKLSGVGDVEYVALRIRALAGQTDQTEGKEVER